MRSNVADAGRVHASSEAKGPQPEPAPLATTDEGSDSVGAECRLPLGTEGVPSWISQRADSVRQKAEAQATTLAHLRLKTMSSADGAVPHAGNGTALHHAAAHLTQSQILAQAQAGSHRWARPFRICFGTGPGSGLTPPTSAPGLA